MPSGGPEERILVWDLAALLKGSVDSEESILRVVRLEADGSQRVWGLSVGRDASGDERIFATEVTGEARVVLLGKDSAGNLDSLRTNANQQLQVEIVKGNRVQADPVAIPSVDGILLDGSVTLGGAGIWEVTFEIVDVSSPNAVWAVTELYVDIGGNGGPPSQAEFIMRGTTIPTTGSSGEVRLTMAGDDDLRGFGGGGDKGAIRFIRVERVYAES
jgi:hypothetical protein